MNKRDFLKVLGAGAAGVAAIRLFPSSHSFAADARMPKHKYWAWITKDFNPSIDDWKRQLGRMRESGIDAILPEIFDSRKAYWASKHLPVAEERVEKILPLAKEAGLEVHAWMWSMPCNVEDVVKKHPDWYVVNRKGESAAEKPAYVPYYKFLCPSHPEVQEFVKTRVVELSQYEDLSGVHFDYIRFPDVILPVGLQPKYGITQDREYPEYDYCYCPVCRHDFEQQTGTDPLKLDDPPASEAWKQFRYNRISHLVNDILIPAVHEQKKVASAAVFPNWENVRQQWSTWHLDAALPMLYHGFYNKGIDWIGEQTKKEVQGMKNGAPIYSGLFVPQLKADELPQAIDTALKAGAGGVALFAAPVMSEQHWTAFASAVRS